MTIREAIGKGSIKLKMKNIDSPKQKARMLMQFMLGKTRQYILVYDETNLSKNQEELYFKNIEKLEQGIPLQHITNQQEFMKMNFYVNKNVLIPRQDTETLVEEVIRNSKKNQCQKNTRLRYRKRSNCHITCQIHRKKPNNSNRHKQ